MNKKEAVAYAQIALESMLHSTYKQEINLENFAIEMKQAFKLYSKDIVLIIAEGKVFAEKRLKTIKTGSDHNANNWKK